MSMISLISLRYVFLFYYHTISLSHGLMLRDNVEHCANVTLLQYRDPPGPMIALAALPGSGSHWVSHLLQMATGIHTGSKYAGTMGSQCSLGIYIFCANLFGVPCCSTNSVKSNCRLENYQKHGTNSGHEISELPVQLSTWS